MERRNFAVSKALEGTVAHLSVSECDEGVPLGMHGIHPEYLDPDFRKAAAVLVREEPDEEEEDEEEKGGDEEDDDGDEGYSE